MSSTVLVIFFTDNTVWSFAADGLILFVAVSLPSVCAISPLPSCGLLSLSPCLAELSDPCALVVLLHNDLVVVVVDDLLTPGDPCFENPYSMDIHESPVTCCTYLADCPAHLTPALHSAGAR